jgi:metal-responsive CopG/Arc/MetJ family transcriptional regulator
MKMKTSITLSEDLLKAMDVHVTVFKTRSEFLEAAAWAFIARMIREEQNARDLEIINQHADRLNREVAEVLTYQAIP